MAGNTNAIGRVINSSSPLPVNSGGTGTSTTFTQGSVVFAGASGVYSQNNSSFFWNDTNKRLGIGTTSLGLSSPGLDILSTLSTVSAVISTTFTGSAHQANLYICRGDSPNGGAAIQFYTGSPTGGTQDWIIGTLNNTATSDPTQFLFYSGGAVRMSLSTAGLVNIPGLSASTLVATDASKNLTTSVTGLSPQFTGLTLSSSLTLSSFTAGSVLFAGTSGVVSQNNSNLFWNNSSNFLGIGTNAPHAYLQFGNNLVSRTIVLYENANNDNQYLGFGVNAATLRYQVGDTSNDHVFYAGVNSTTSKELCRITGGGNVNIAGGSGTTLALGGSASGLSGLTPACTFSTNYGAGNYINFATFGRNIGIFTNGQFFMSYGLQYSSGNFVYQNIISNSPGAVFELDTSGGFLFLTAPTGANNTTATVTTQLSIGNTGTVNIRSLPTTTSASALVGIDGSNNLVSTNTLAPTVLGNIPKVIVTSLTVGSGTYTVPTPSGGYSCTHIRVRVWGAGGGGGGVATAAGAAGAGGGAGGSYVETIITSPAASYVYSVAAGGAGGANTGGAGGSPVATTFGTAGMLTAGSGAGGSGTTASVAVKTILGGSAGAVSGGTINALGSSGGVGLTFSGTVSVSGQGGASPCGGGAAPPQANVASANGTAGQYPGGGGGGANITNGGAAATGGTGADGLIIVEAYFNG